MLNNNIIGFQTNDKLTKIKTVNWPPLKLQQTFALFPKDWTDFSMSLLAISWIEGWFLFLAYWSLKAKACKQGICNNFTKEIT